LTIAGIALLLTLFTGFLLQRVERWLVSYLQHFTGALFVFSGWVKAVDPLGTAYKMEQYFAEFEATFSGAWLSSLAPMFPWLSEYAIGFSVFVIVFEIVLGLMLLLGAARKFTSWAFLLLVGFFTFLTGFTYLTGYVPDGVNFFQFGQWGEYVATNMKVTDCGCFGDFLKLEPRTSFLKDVFLLAPALLFVFQSGKLHQLFSPAVRGLSIGLATVGLIIYCFSNFAWDLPHADFRPFYEGRDIAERKAMEEEAQANVEIIAYQLTNKSSGKVVELPYEQYLKEYKKYPKEEWSFKQIKSEPAVERSKISDFTVETADYQNVTDELLQYSGYSLMIVAHKLGGKEEKHTVARPDTVYRVDSLRQRDSIVARRVVDRVENKQVTERIYHWEDEKLQPWTQTVNPVMAQAQQAGLRVYGVTAYADPGKLEDFRRAVGADYPIYVADDILLKTIVRSNPGIVLWKDGVIVKKWHYRKLPSFETIREKFMEQKM